MRVMLNSPIFLLLATGTLVGHYFPLGKVASDAGISAIAWAMVLSLGACAVLLPILIYKRSFTVPTGRTLRYVTIAGVISFVLPNILLFSVIPYVGAGYTGLMFALSPVFTLAIALLFRLKGPNLYGLIGIALGCVGATIIAWSRGSLVDAPPYLWIFAALMIPVVLASANVYRTIDWPDEGTPDDLAFWSHLFAIGIFVILLVSLEGVEPFYALADAATLTLIQALLAGLTFPLYFRLQRHGGPVLLSQLGYVAAAVGMVMATVMLGERYGLFIWGGALVVAVGIAATVYSQLATAK